MVVDGGGRLLHLFYLTEITMAQARKLSWQVLYSLLPLANKLQVKGFLSAQGVNLRRKSNIQHDLALICMQHGSRPALKGKSGLQCTHDACTYALMLASRNQKTFQPKAAALKMRIAIICDPHDMLYYAASAPTPHAISCYTGAKLHQQLPIILHGHQVASAATHNSTRAPTTHHAAWAQRCISSYPPCCTGIKLHQQLPCRPHHATQRSTCTHLPLISGGLKSSLLFHDKIDLCHLNLAAGRVKARAARWWMHKGCIARTRSSLSEAFPPSIRQHIVGSAFMIDAQAYASCKQRLPMFISISDKFYPFKQLFLQV
eukprot:1158426-Pelagomonas_calceolata.AAC.5